MFRYRLINGLAVIAAIVAGVPLWAQRNHGTVSNIVLILADDLGYGDLGCYGQTKIKTPHIDRLAAEGMRFTQFYAGSTVCAPSRCVLMTGIHNGRGRVRDNIPHGVHLLPEDVTVAESLQQAGLRTGGFGKWSLGDVWEAGSPLRKGFDRFYGYPNQDHAHFYYPHFLWDDDRVILLPGNRPNADYRPRDPQYGPDLCADQAVRFVEESARAKKRFFLYFPTILPHFSEFPLKSTLSHAVPSAEPYSSEDWPTVEKNYAAMVTRMDSHVGRILDKLKELGIEQDTLVVFTSDNGPFDGSIHDTNFFRSAGPFRGVKRDLYEGGIRVPLIARWPGVIHGGSVNESVASGIDLFPTCAELAGAKMPSNIDGISLAPILRGEKTAKVHEFLYWDYGHGREEFLQAVRMGDWKAVRNTTKGAVELYNLAQDIGEQHDVAGQNPKIVKKLVGYMDHAYEPSSAYPVKSVAKYAH